MQKSHGSLQVYACEFRVCKSKQTYVSLFHTLVSYHAPNNQEILQPKKDTNINI